MVSILRKDADMVDDYLNRANGSGTIELVNAGFHYPKTAIHVWLAVVAVIFFMLASYSLVFGWEEALAVLNPAALISSYFKTWRATPVYAVFIILFNVVLLMYLTIFIPMAKRERIVVDSISMTFRSSFPLWIKWIRPDWEILWGEIESVKVVKNVLATHLPRAVKIYAKGEERQVFPEIWKTIEEATKPIKLSFKQLRKSPETTIKNMMDSVIIKQIQDAGIEIDPGSAGKVSAMEFAVDKNPYTRAVVILFVALGLYIFIDGVLLHETYPSVPIAYEINWFIISLIAILGTTLWLRSKEVPWGVCAGLGFILLFVLFPALYIGTLRANILTDSDGLKSYYYHVEIGKRFTLVPENPELPDITYFNNGPFWHQFLSGELIKIELRRGGIGIWQFNLEKVYELMRDYDEREREKRKIQGVKKGETKVFY